MKYIVVGAGRLGAELAYRLSKQGHDVVVIDLMDVNMDNLPADYRGRTLTADPMNREVLRQAGIEGVDGVAVVSNNDSVNAVVGHLARTLYHVPNVVVRNYDPRWRPVLEAFGLQIISPSSWGAQRIEELLYQSTLRAVFSAGNGEVEIYEFIVPPMWRGRPVNELFSEGLCRVMALTRAGKAFMPDGSFAMETGDIVHISSTAEGVEELRRRLQHVAQESK